MVGEAECFGERDGFVMETDSGKEMYWERDLGQVLG